VSVAHLVCAVGQRAEVGRDELVVDGGVDRHEEAIVLVNAAVPEAR
jgi:hypothetical protein